MLLMTTVDLFLFVHRVGLPLKILPRYGQGEITDRRMVRQDRYYQVIEKVLYPTLRSNMIRSNMIRSNIV